MTRTEFLRGKVERVDGFNSMEGAHSTLSIGDIHLRVHIPDDLPGYRAP